MTIFNNIFNRDPAAVEELRRRQSQTARARLAALPPLGQLLFRVQLRKCTFLGAINAWIALGASEDATARAAARALDSLAGRVVHAGSRSLSLAAGAVVGAVARGAASVPVLRLADADASVTRALAPADAVAAEPVSSTFSLKAVSPPPDIVMTDASASTSAGAALEDVAPAPAAADGYESDGSLTLDQLRERARLRQDAASSDDDSDDEDQDSFQAIAPDADAEDVEEALDAAESTGALQTAESTGAASIYLATVQRYLAEAVPERIFRPGIKDACSALCKTNYVWFASSQRMLRYPEGYTLLAIFDTEDPSSINAIPREEFLARVNAKKQDLNMPVWPSKSEVAARRAEWEAGTPMFKHDGCSIAFPENNFERNFSVHRTAHKFPRGHFERKAGQPPTPLTVASHYCRSKEACEDCQKWVQKVAEGRVSLQAPGAGWVPSRDQVLRCAARVRAALPSITFGGVDLRVATERKAAAAAPKSRSKTLEEKLMGLTTGQAVGAVKHALRQCNAVGFMGAHMDSAKYKAEFVPQFMAHLGLTDVNKVPAQSTLYGVYQAHKRKQTGVAVEPAPPPRSKRARRAPTKMED